MKNKILLLGLVILGIVMCTSAVSAYYTIPKGTGPNPWVVVGGRTATNGGFASSYMLNLIPGTYYGAPCNCGSAIAYYDASRPCTCGNSGGSWFGGGYGGYGSSGSSYGWGGAWGNYGNYNTYGGNVGWAKNYPSYNYNYMYTGYV